MHSQGSNPKPTSSGLKGFSTTAHALLCLHMVTNFLYICQKNYTSPNEARNLPVRSKKMLRKKERRELSTSIFLHVITIVINLKNDMHNNMNVRKIEVAPCASTKPLVLVSGASPTAACCSHTGATPPTAPPLRIAPVAESQGPN